MPANWQGGLWRDASGDLRTQHGVRTDTLVLVRPDGYVAFRSQPAELPPLLAHLDKYLIAGSKNGDAAGRSTAAVTG